MHGAISPMQNIGPDQIRLRELLARLRDDSAISEVILAAILRWRARPRRSVYSQTAEARRHRTTRIAHGIPMGGDLEYADEVTLAKAMEGRREI